jgi:hypothetical protein
LFGPIAIHPDQGQRAVLGVSHDLGSLLGLEHFGILTRTPGSEELAHITWAQFGSKTRQIPYETDQRETVPSKTNHPHSVLNSISETKGRTFESSRAH